MKLNIYECLKCCTYTFGVGKYKDGLNCYRCDGPVIPIRSDTKNLSSKEEAKLFDKEIIIKKELMDVIEALDKLDKNYVITKSHREVPDMHYGMNVWRVKEV